MKRIDLLCCGPSLALYPGRQHDTAAVVAVNTAANWHEADWIVASDWQTLPMVTRQPFAGWIVPKATIFYYPNLTPMPILYESFCDLLPMTPPQCNFSGIAALVACRTLSANHVRVWGMDLVPTDEPGRDTARFRRERQHRDQVLDEIRALPDAPHYEFMHL